MRFKILRHLRIWRTPLHFICDNVFGPHHSHQHRMAAGLVVMGAGAGLAQYGAHFEWEVMHFVFDGVGYMIHGLGAVPYAEMLAAIATRPAKE